MTIVTLVSCNEWANFTETGQPPLDRIDAFWRAASRPSRERSEGADQTR